MSRYSDAVNNEGVDPESDDALTPVYARRDPEDDRIWILFHAESREPIDYTRGTQHDLAEFCLSEGYDLRDGPLTAY
jgi:hypothetical protein